MSAERAFHLTGPAAIAMVKPEDTAGHLNAEDLRFLDEFNRAGDSLERQGYFVAITFRDTILVVPPPDSFHLSPWPLVNKQSAAYFFLPGRDPYRLPRWSSAELLSAVDAYKRTPMPARALIVARPSAFAFRTLSVGTGHTCGAVAEGKAFCWGANTSGQLGNGTANDTASPTAVAGGLRWVEISAGGYNTCGRTSAGHTMCWGVNGAKSVSMPQEFGLGLRFVRLSAGDGHSCALTAAGRAFCWGANTFGELGGGTSTATGTSPTYQWRPLAVAGRHRFVEIAAGYAHTCARTPGGQAHCWGDNGQGQLGDGTTTSRRTPVAVAGGLRFVELRALGYGHTCAHVASGQAYCWGGNAEGQLGDGTKTTRLTPVPVAGGQRFVELSAGYRHTCGLSTDGRGFCWGGSNNGERGDGVQGDLPTRPSPVAGDLRFVELRAGGQHTCGLTRHGAAFCWGWNDHGQLGDGSRNARLGPVQVAPRP